MHIEEDKIEQLIISPEAFSVEEKELFISHINECIYCKEVYEMYQKIYLDLEEGIKEPATHNDEEIARRIYQRLSNTDEKKLLTEKSTRVQIYDGKAEIIEKPKWFSLQGFLYYIRNYPLQFGSLSLVTVLAIAFLFVMTKRSVKDDNPVYAEVKNGVLNIYNSGGDVLWKKTAYGIPGTNSNILMGWGFPIKRHINITDIDADNKNEVLLSGDNATEGLFRSDSLYCYNFDGTKRWVTGPENVHSGSIPNWKRTKWQIQDYFQVRVKNNKKLFVLANDQTYAMTIISEINTTDGKILSSLYHSGWFFYDLFLDLDNDGNNEIILGGTSNDYYRPVIMILRAGGFKGAIDKNELLNPNNSNKGNALYYLLLPTTNYHKLLSSTNVVEIRDIGKTDKGFIVTTHEVQLKNDNVTIGIVYSFDENMHIKNIIPTNGFQKKYNDLYEKGIFKEPLDSTYFKNLKNSILYWDGDKFVNYPTKNKYWDR